MSPRRRRGEAADHSTDASTTAPTTTPVTHLDVGALDVERAMRLVRIAAAMIAAAAALGARTATTGLRGPTAALVVIGGALVINLVTAWTSRKGWNTAGALVAQALDVAGALGLVVLLDEALDGSAWVLLLLPIVMGGVRFGAPGTLLGWTLACVGYLGLVVTGVLQVADDPTAAFGTGLQRSAFLLAIAVPVAALTQWLQQRWEHQRRLTAAASLRAQRLELVESLARSFVGASEPNLLANLADAGVRLGFPTVTITMHGDARSTTVAAVGEGRRLPTDDVTVRPEPGETLVTHWSGVEGGEALTSVSILLDASGRTIVFHGWSPSDVDEDAATAFGLLGAHAGLALRAARFRADLERQARQDPLTGLLNRRAFDEHLDRRAEVGTAVALLVLDVDHFKQINDVHGHPAGDQVLKVIAARLQAATRIPDVRVDAAVARIGGDEFAMVLSDVPLDTVADIADRIETSMREPVALGPTQIPVSFSIGIADGVDGWIPRGLITAADEATYQAKAHGRNRTCWAPGPVGEGAAPQPRPTVPTTPGADPLISLLHEPMDPSAPTPHTPTRRPAP